MPRHYFPLPSRVAIPLAVLPLITLALWLAAPVRAEEDEAILCPKPLQADCLLESAEEALGLAAASGPTDAGWLNVNQGYTLMKQPPLAWSAARRIQAITPFSDAIARTAALYRRAGEQDRASIQLQQALDRLTPLSCQEKRLPAFRLGLAVGLTGLNDQWTRVDPTARQAAQALTVQRLVEQGSIAAAERLLSGVSDAHWHDLGWLPLATAKAIKVDDATVESYVSRFKTPEMRRDFWEITYPLALLKDGQDARAIDHAHRLTDLPHKARLFRLFAEQYLERGESTRALHVAEFARDFAKKIPEGYDSSSALRFLGQVYLKLGHIEPARAVFAEALTAADRIPILERRLSAVIGIVEIQGKNEDIKGARQSFFNALNGGLLEKIDASGHSGELGRLITNLDGKLAIQDRIRLIGMLLKVKSPAVRSKMLHQISDLTPTDRILAESGDARPEVRKQLQAHYDVVEVIRIRSLLASIDAEIDNKAQAMEQFKAIRGDIEHLVMPEMPAAAMKDIAVDLRLFLAREEARVGEVLLAVKDYRQAKKASQLKPGAVEPVARELVRRESWTALEEILPADRLALLAAAEDKTRSLLGFIQSKAKEAKRRELYSDGFFALLEAREWKVSAEWYEAIRRFDKLQWDEEGQVLAVLDDKARQPVIDMLLATGRFDAAYPQIRQLQNPLALANGLARLGRMLAEATPEANWGVPKSDLFWLMQPIPSRLSMQACPKG